MTDKDLTARAQGLLDGATPGPWRVGPVDDTIVTAPDGTTVAEIDGDYNSPDLWPMMEANARLIAAAPDLAQALIASEAARKLAEERLAKAVEALREIAIHPEDRGDTMPGDFRDYYRDVCDFAARVIKEITE